MVVLSNQKQIILPIYSCLAPRHHHLHRPSVCWSSPRQCDHVLACVNEVKQRSNIGLSTATGPQAGLNMGHLADTPMFYCNTCGGSNIWGKHLTKTPGTLYAIEANLFYPFVLKQSSCCLNFLHTSEEILTHKTRVIIYDIYWLMLGIYINLSLFILPTPPFPSLSCLNVEQNGLNFQRVPPKLLFVSDCVDETFISTL